MSAKQAQSQLAVVEQSANPPAVNEGATILAMIDRVMAMPDVPVEKVEQMFALYQKVEAGKAQRAYAAALADMQAALPVVVSKGAIKGNDDKVRSKYAKWEDICEAIRPHLTAHGFAISFGIDNADAQRVTVTCTLSHREGHSEKTAMSLGIDSSGGKQGPQGWGSAVSYAKRYTATAMLNIASRGEDDDGQAAANEYITDDQQERLKQLLSDINGTHEAFLKVAKADCYDKIKASQFADLEKRLLAKAREAAR